MSPIQLKVVYTGLFFLFICLSGIWLSHSGRPLNVVINTIHKLISLAAMVFLAITLYQMNQAAKLSAIEVIAAAVTGLFFIGAIITGGLLSASKPMPAAVLALHRIIPFLTVASTGVTLYLHA